jgi:hypothetical protein
MELIGKKVYESIKISVVRKFKRLLSDAFGSQRFAPAAQYKIQLAMGEWSELLDDADTRIQAIRTGQLSDAEKADAIENIENERNDVNAYEVCPITEWSERNTPTQMAQLREAKMLKTINVVEEPAGQ